MVEIKRISLVFLIMLIFFSVPVFASEESITFQGITTQIPEVSKEIIETEDPENNPLGISTKVAKPATDAIVGAGISKESVSNIISKFANDTTVIGIDVSRHQGEIDWKKVAESGVKFAILRCGFRGTSVGNIFVDPTFEQNAKNALANGIPIGAYFYSTALNEEEALQEAYLTVETIKKFALQYPVYYDFEDFLPDDNRTDYLPVSQINKNAKIFLDYVQSKGYTAALYGSANYLKNKWDISLLHNPDVWVAHYYVDKPNYSPKYQMWQYTDKGSVPGISGNVDVDVDYYYWASMKVSVSVLSHIETYGWENSWKKDGETSGTVGKSKRAEAFRLKINSSILSGGIRYKSYIEKDGWEKSWKKDGEISGTTGKSKRIEAIRIELTGNIAKYYDVYYRVHCQNYGWLGWAKNGETSGTEFLDKRIEAIQVKIVLKQGPIPGTSKNKWIRLVNIQYQSHVQSYGWMEKVINGEISGTEGESKRLEAMKIYVTENGKKIEGAIAYRSHIQGIGWENIWKSDGLMTGTEGQSRRLEAIQIRLTGEIAETYDIYYRVHCQDYGWLGWARNGEFAGTEGQSRRLEAIEIRLVAKGDGALPLGEAAFVK